TMPSVSTTWRTRPICWRRMSGAAVRLALYSATASCRNVGSGRSKAAITPSGRLSRNRLMSIDVNPKTALVTCPEAVAMSGGRAKNARYVKELPSSSRSLLMASRCQSTGHHALGDGLHLRAIGHGPLLDEREGVLLRHAMAVHQDALGPVD